MSASSSAGRRDPLVGRTAELDDLDEVLASVVTGAAATVLLEGEPGVGRSRLVEAVQGSAALLGADVRAASGRPGSAAYALLADALLTREPGAATQRPHGPVVAELLALLDVLPAGPEPARSQHVRAEELFTALVRRHGDDGPWVLALDDLHLADPASLVLLARLAGDGAVPHALTVMTLRPSPRPEVAAVVAAWTRAGARYLELRPLTGPASVELARRLLGAPPGPVLRGVLATTGGNPRLVVEVVRAVRAQGALGVHDGVVDLVGRTWHADVDRVGQAHVAGLDATVHRLLGQASVLGSSFVVGDLAAVAGVPVTDCWRGLRHGLAAGVVHARGDRLVFRHDLVRAALYDGLEPAQRRALHARAAWALREAGAPSHVVAAHLERAR